jgi:hypothetical protein
LNYWDQQGVQKLIKPIGISGTALVALMLAAAPVGAVSLNIGGEGGLVSIDSGSSPSSGGSDSGPTDSVSGGDSSTGGSSGDDLLYLGKRPLLDLSGDAETDATVEIDFGVGGKDGGGSVGQDGIVDVDTGGDNGVIVDLFGPDKALIDAELGLEEKGGPLVDAGSKDLIEIDTDGQKGVIVELFGKGDAIADVDVPLGGNNNSGEGLARIDTEGEDGLAVHLLGEDRPLADVGLGLEDEDAILGSNLVSLDASEEAAIIVDLFGSGDGAETGDVVRTGDLVDINGENDAAANVDLFRPSAKPSEGAVTSRSLSLTFVETDQFAGAGTSGEEQTSSGSLSGEGAGAAPEDGNVDNTETVSVAPAGKSSDADGEDGSSGAVQSTDIQTVPRLLPAGPAASGRVAAVGSGAVGCFSPNQAQIEHLLGRKQYSVDVATEWRSAEEVRVVPINLCPGARTRLEAALEADANLNTLHAAVAANDQITAAIEPNYAPDDVLAVDQSGEDLSVYVY